MSKYAAGQVIEVSGYPFVRTVFNGAEWDGEKYCEYQNEGWKPGCDRETEGYETFFVAEGSGEMILTVISTHKPGGFMERVFYTRKWRDPDGNVFGAEKLRVLAAAAFTRLTRGYRHNFEVVE